MAYWKDNLFRVVFSVLLKLGQTEKQIHYIKADAPVLGNDARESAVIESLDSLVVYASGSSRRGVSLSANVVDVVSVTSKNWLW